MELMGPKGEIYQVSPNTGISQSGGIFAPEDLEPIQLAAGRINAGVGSDGYICVNSFDTDRDGNPMSGDQVRVVIDGEWTQIPGLNLHTFWQIVELEREDRRAKGAM